jgi:tetratricopeptide (TPR) repeat protein
LLPALVYKYKRGACLGTSLIILLFAEKVHCPLYGVLLPGHFFCRFDDGKTSLNIEPNKSGFSHPDSYYLARYDRSNRPWYDLKNLSKRETIGVLCYNAGTVCLNRKRSDRAAAYFAEAARRLSWFPEAQGNLALAYAQTGLVDSAMAIFQRLFAAHPDMPGLAANFGATAITCRRYQKAADVFKKGLIYFPDDSTLLSGFAQASKRKKSP